ncbi:MAG: MBL fold metallo-hydrolase [Armatimonadota bacterium]
MIIRNFFEPKLAQASYLVGCAKTGEAIVIDPLRDIAQYLEMAAAEGLAITHVTETHIHADYLSGTRELAAATEAKVFLSDEGGQDWTYEFSTDPNVTLMKDGHTIRVGNLSLKAIHTPGHTPEHMSFLLTDHPASEEPHSLFTGDFIFAGDVGRPDLLEKAANIAGTMEKGARVLFQSIQRTSALPDSLLLWPAHGAGSACGKSLGGSPVTSLGYERKANWAFLVANEDDFVEEVLKGQPEPPFYFKEMKMRNKRGPAVLGAMPVVRRVESAGSKDIVDVRAGSAIREGYVSGTLALPDNKGLITWAGWLLNYDVPIVLIADSQSQANRVARDMATIGLDVASGWMPAPDKVEPFKLTTCGQVTNEEYVLDVRGQSEWNDAHMKVAHHIPLGYLSQRLDEVPRDSRVVVHCAGGNRSPIAVSILKKAGFENVAEIPGGLSDVSKKCPGKIESA